MKENDDTWSTDDPKMIEAQKERMRSYCRVFGGIDLEHITDTEDEAD